ncbi:MAG TPA: hypothetical protein VFF53_07910 [Geobacteraceae bacterium]|nr:hypothetical protein [Geobacteraceae bacterium]
MLNNIGSEVYKTWSEEQKRIEIDRLVQAYRSGLPISIVCMTAEAIAGSRGDAKRHLVSLMSLADRLEAISSADGEKKDIRRFVRAVLD